MLSRFLILSLLCSILGGTLLTFIQVRSVIPIILNAESFEGGPVISYAQHQRSMTPHSHVRQSHAHKPAPIESRTVKTAIMNIALSFVWSLIVIITMIYQKSYGLGGGLLASSIGFYAFFVAPNLGLPPELPGSLSAGLELRQMWWALAGISSFIGLNLMVKHRFHLRGVLGLLTLCLPYVFTAPQPDFHGGSAPIALAIEFERAVWISNFVTWIAIGALLGLLINQFDSGNKAYETV